MREKYYDTRVKFLLKKLATYSELGVAFNARKAIRLVLDEMSSSKGFKRHDGRDYFVHPVAIAQTAIDFKLVNFATGNRLNQEDIELNKESDALLTACLLHDIIEDIVKEKQSLLDIYDFPEINLHKMSILRIKKVIEVVKANEGE